MCRKQTAPQPGPWGKPTEPMLAEASIHEGEEGAAAEPPHQETLSILLGTLLPGLPSSWNTLRSWRALLLPAFSEKGTRSTTRLNNFSQVTHGQEGGCPKLETSWLSRKEIKKTKTKTKTRPHTSVQDSCYLSVAFLQPRSVKGWPNGRKSGRHPETPSSLCIIFKW